MNLLGAYPSQLSTWHVQALTQLLNSGIELGDYGGGKLVNAAALQAIAQQGTDFTTLPQVIAGLRAQAHSINYPLDLLTARYAAMVAERDDFLNRMNLFLSILEQDSEAIDRLLYAAALETWVALQPPLSQARKFYCDYTATHGSIASDVPATDPANTGITYTDAFGKERILSDVAFIVNGAHRHGLGAPVDQVDRTAPINLRWALEGDPVADSESLLGTDWASYAILAPEPRLHYQIPTAAVVLPKSRAGQQVLRVKGSQDGNLPVYVKTLFAPRRRVVPVFPDTRGIPQPVSAAGARCELSPYRIPKDDMIVFDATRSYELGQDFDIDLDSGRRDFVALSPVIGRQLQAALTEYFPAYQCSINNIDWSPVIQFDPAAPFADVEQAFFPLDIQDGWFPAVDELGTALGIYFQPVGTLDSEYLIRIETRANDNCGATVKLEVEFDRPGYLNGLRLTPFTTFPCRLKRIDAEGMLTESGLPLFDGDVLLDRAVSIRFSDSTGSPVYVRRMFLTLVQENYSLKEHIVESPGELRRDTLAKIQALTPVSTRPMAAALPVQKVGAQYEFGFRDIAGERWYPAPPGVMVSGPFDVSSTPEIVRLDTDQTGQVECYLLYEVNQAVVQGPRLIPGTSISFAAATNHAQATRLYLKWAFRDEFAVLSRSLLQVA